MSVDIENQVPHVEISRENEHISGGNRAKFVEKISILCLLPPPKRYSGGVEIRRLIPRLGFFAHN